MATLIEKISNLEEIMRTRKIYVFLVVILMIFIAVFFSYKNFYQTKEADFSLLQKSNSLTTAAHDACSGDNFLTRIAFAKMVENDFDYQGVLPEHGYIAVNEKCKIALALYHDGECAVKSILDDDIEVLEKDYHDCYLTKDVFYEAEIGGLIEEGFLPISNIEDLKAIGSNENHLFAADYAFQIEQTASLDQKYILINDLDFEDEQWLSIGAYNEPFTGIFDGNGHKIYNFNNETEEDIFSSEVIDEIALFHTIEDATIENLTLQGSLRGHYYLAPLAIYAKNSSLSNLNVSFTIEGTTWLSGLIVVNENTTITKTKVDTSITGADGLAGFSVEGDAFSITNSYVVGTISGVELISDFVLNGTSGSIKNSYSLLNIDAEYFLPIVGGNWQEILIENTYYGIDSFDYDVDIDAARLKSELKEKKTFENWDFENIWYFEENNYPTLR